MAKAMQKDRYKKPLKIMGESKKGDTNKSGHEEEASSVAKSTAKESKTPHAEMNEGKAAPGSSTSGTDGIPSHYKSDGNEMVGRHAHERMQMTHRHSMEHKDMHHRHEMEHRTHEMGGGDEE